MLICAFPPPPAPDSEPPTISTPAALPLCYLILAPSFLEILLCAGGVALPPASRAHPQEPAAGGGEAASGPRGQHHHSHPCGSGGLLRTHMQPSTRARGGRWGHQAYEHLCFIQEKPQEVENSEHRSSSSGQMRVISKQSRPSCVNSIKKLSADWCKNCVSLLDWLSLFSILKTGWQCDVMCTLLKKCKEMWNRIQRRCCT